jgi:hypothetical protein
VISVLLHLVTPIFLPILNTTIYFGQGSPNIWHSPTFIVTKPFILTIILLVITLLKDLKNKASFRNVVLAGILLMISVFFKPNFAIAFIPALGIYILFKHRSEFKAYFLSFILVLPAILLLGYQFISTYFLSENNLGGTGDQIIFTFFGAWKVHSPCIPFSVLRGIIFPVSVLFIRWKEARRSSYILFSWILYFVAFLEVSFLAERNSFNAFNFSNGYNFSLISLYTFSAIELLKWAKASDFSLKMRDFKYSLMPAEHKKLFFSTVLFYLCAGSGIIYLVRQLLGYGFS